ncbi:hypothetical protein D1610_02190 [Sphingomonas gilva]|uniref:Uncharacterized protein n=1 Tax=Sphingomonas gilva TaxID=2305907 RepID=A0A396RQR0_9SPHN|nr:hypothetical protein D1610_02190 [Sphingomonas gilva]
MPGVAAAALDGVRTVSVRAAGGSAKTAAACYRAARPLAKGELLASSDLSAAACGDDDRARLGFDRANGLIFAAEAIPAGRYLGPVAPVPGVDVAPGATLTLRSVAGPAVIERKVTAVQPGRNGQRMFVQDAEGTIFAVSLAIAQEQDTSDD